MTRIDVSINFYPKIGTADTSAYAYLEPGAPPRLIHLAEDEALGAAEAFLPVRIERLGRFLNEGLGINPEIRNGGTVIIGAAAA